jgi:hypothetical protein
MRKTRLTAGLLSLVLLGGGLAACDEDAQEAHNAPGEAGQSANTEEKVTGDAAVSSKPPPGSEDISKGAAGDAGAAATDESGATAEAGEPEGDGSAKKNGTTPNKTVETGDRGSAGHSDRVWQGEKDPVWSEDKGGVEN